MEASKGNQRVVVVGVDGSADSIQALAWAANYVEETGRVLHAVTAFEHAMGFGFAATSLEGLEREARAALEHALSKVLGESPSIEVRREVVQGPARKVLLDASRDAELLVVGTRGLGGFSGLLLGSVSDSCVRHADCSVVVVRSR